MRKRSRTFFVAALGLGVLAAVGASISTAGFDTRGPAGLDPAVIHDEGDLPPVAGKAMFATAFGAEPAVCMSKDAVVASLSADEAAYGGKTYVLAEGLEQAFADVWRREAAVDPVRVSSVVAHVFSDRSGTDWTADVVEIDALGCAMSRTLVPGDVWTDLLQTALGIEV